MKKLSLLLIAVLALTLNAAAQNPKEIVDKCVAALGGEEAVKNLNNYKAKGELSVTQMGMELKGSLEAIEMGVKSWRRVEIVFGNETFVIVQAYDGKAAWQDQMGTTSDQPLLNYESELDHRFSLLVTEGASYSLGKETEIEGKKTVGIDVEFEGKTTTFFIELENYTVLETVYKDVYFGESFTKETLEIRNRYENYREVNGTLFPMKTTLYQEGKRQAEFTFSDVEFDFEAPDEKFERPDQALDLRYGEEIIH
jgi:outer membrane lipoprotein-sorting protein